MPLSFGAYRVLHQTGSGVLGPVFRAFDPDADRLVVIKAFKLDLLPEQTVKCADALRRVVARGASHPSLVPLIDAGLEGTTPFLAMAHAPGETLDVLLRRTPVLPLDRALPLLADVAAALEAAWESGGGHGALHPRDIFVTVDGKDTPAEVTVTGAGLVAAFDSAGVTLPARRPYAAPERVGGLSWDIRADVFSLGAIAHEVLTGRRPLATGEQDGAFDLGANPAMRVALRRVLARALTESPASRLETPQAFIDALLAVRDGDYDVLPAPAEATAVASPVPLQTALPMFPPAATAEHDEPLSAPPVVAAPQEPVEPVLAAPAHIEGVRPDPRPTPARSTTHPLFDDHVSPVMPVPAPVVVPRVAYPWGAIAAVLVAGISVGVVGGYQWGRRASEVVTPAPVTPAPIVAQAPASPETEVKVAPPSEAPVPSDTEVATPPAEPVPVPDARRAVANPPKPAVAPVARGTIDVDSRPRGARVLIDGRVAGTTPLKATQPAGSHTVTVEKAGHKPVTAKATVEAGRKATVRVRLEAQPVRGRNTGPAK